MAINFNDYVEQNEKREAEKANKSVDESVKRNYFSLDDGEKKVVVINFDPASEKIQPVHSYYSNSDGRYTKIKCLGKGCPLCAKANSYGKDEKNYFKSWASPRVFLQIFDEDGTEYVWERPFKFVQSSVAPLIEDLGDLSKVFLTISRQGTGTATKYNIIPALSKGSIRKVPEELAEIIKNTPKNESPRGLYLDLEEQPHIIEEFLETGKINFGVKAEDYEAKEAKEVATNPELKSVDLDDSQEIPF